MKIKIENYNDHNITDTNSIDYIFETYIEYLYLHSINDMRKNINFFLKHHDLHNSKDN